MCIMEVRPGQRTSTIAQAMFHNTYTILGDLDMLVKVLKARNEDNEVNMVLQAQEYLKRASAIFLAEFGTFVAKEVNPDEHVHDHDKGHERTFVEQAHEDAKLARRYETR